MLDKHDLMLNNVVIDINTSEWARVIVLNDNHVIAAAGDGNNRQLGYDEIGGMELSPGLLDQYGFTDHYAITHGTRKGHKAYRNNGVTVFSGGDGYYVMTDQAAVKVAALHQVQNWTYFVSGKLM